MLKRLAKFRLRQPKSWLRPSWRLTPGPQQNAPANDNRPGRQLPQRRRPGRSQRLVCRWTPMDGRTGLGCRWDIEDIADRPPPEPGESLAGRAFHNTVFKPPYQKQAARAARSITRPRAGRARPFERIHRVAPTSLDNVIWSAVRRASFQLRTACNNPFDVCMPSAW